MKKLFLVFIFLTAFKAFAQPQISYILPDIGTPDMNTYVEIIGPAGRFNNFGSVDGISTNDPDNRIECVNAADNDKLMFGPIITSWDGRMISTQIFVNPWVQPNDWDWERLAPAFRIPIRVRANGQLSNIDTFYIVRPFPFGNQTTNNEVILGSSTLGKRSRRGAMIVDSMVLAPGRTYSVSTGDQDASTPGSQGFLPFVLISKGRIVVNNNFTTLSVNGGQPGSGRAGSGGPGGGGGGGRFCDVNNTSTTNGDDGGSGFTGGGAGGRYRAIGPNPIYRVGGGGSGANGTGGNSANSSGKSLNDVPGGTAPATESSGGGTGHPFGTSGLGCDNGNVSTGCNNPGGYGGGSGHRDNQRGGSGGYGGEGSPQNSQGGKIHGNIPVVPIAGGSGGASGNPRNTTPFSSLCSGSGGGGGGAMQIFGLSLIGLEITANGGNGGTDTPEGGAGSGGYIGAQAKLAIQNTSITANGGNGVQPGGAGRLRADAPNLPGSLSYGTQVSQFRGPTSDTSKQVTRKFNLTGSYNGSAMDVYVRSQNTPWTAVSNISTPGNTWIADITLPGTDTLYYIVAIQREGSATAGIYTYRPNLVMSQAAANIVRVVPAPVIAGDTIRRFPTSLCPGETPRFDTVYVKSIGTGKLVLQTPAFKKNNQGFTLIEPLASQFPLTLDEKGGAKDSVRFIVRFSPPASQGLFTDSLLIQNNDTAVSKRIWRIYYEARKDTAGFAITNPASQEIDTLDFGKICLGNAQTLSYLFKNASSIPVVFDPVNVNLLDKSNFTISIPARSTLAVNQSTSPISVSFSAQSLGKIQTKIYMNITECGFKDSLIIKAEGINSDISFKNDAQFGDVLVTTSKTFNVVLKNEGQNDALVQQVSVVAAPFAVVSTNPAPLPFLLKPGQELTAVVNFTPPSEGDFTSVLKMASLFSVGSSCIDTTEALLSGRGVDLNVQTTRNILDFDTVARCDTKLDSVQVINNGTAPVQITGAASISGPDNTAFRIKSEPGGIPVTLAPGELSKFYVIEFVPQAGSDGAKVAELRIPVSDPNRTPLVVDLFAEQRSLVVSNPSPVVIPPISVPQSGSGDFTITNTGVLDARIQSITSRRGITTVTPVPPQTIPANNGSATFTATIQATTAGQIFDTLEIIYNEPCLDTQYVFISSKGIQGNLAYTDRLLYNVVSVCDSTTRTISYTNTGEADITVQNIALEGTDANVFKIINPIAPNFVLKPDSVLTQDVRFVPFATTDGPKSARVRATILIAGKPEEFVTDLTGERRTAILSAPNSPVVFGTVELNATSEQALTITNTSPFDVLIEQAQLDAIAGNGIFAVEVDQPGVTLPFTLKVDSSINFKVKFTPTAETSYTDTLRLDITSPCNDNKVIALAGNGGSTLRSVISLPDTVAATPAIQNFTIPMYITLDKSPASPVTTSFTAEIAYDGSVFSVASLSKGNITGRTTDAVTGEEVIAIEVNNVLLNTSARTILTELQGNIYLGEVDSTPVRFKSFTWTGTIPRLDSTDDGSIKIDGICYEGGPRLVRGMDTTVLMIAVHPNPANSETEFTTSAIETGIHTLELYNAQGIKVWEEKWTHAGTGREYTFKTQLSNFADGTYTAVLKTPSKTRTKHFVIIK